MVRGLSAQFGKWGRFRLQTTGLMKKSIFILIGILTLSATVVHGQRFGTGFGVIVGEPTGITAKHWLDETTAIDLAFGASFEGRTSLHLHGDYLWHNFTVFPVDQGQLPIYYGVGARYKDNRAQSGNTRDKFGIRVPVGVAYHLENRPLELFAELVPILDLTPRTRVSLNAAVGFRIYFQ